MIKLYHLVFILVYIVLLTACTRATHYQVERYNPETQQVEKVHYTAYYRLDTALIPGQVEVTLITQLNKDNLRSIYRLKKLTRRLSPNDYMDLSDSYVYLKNLTQETIPLQLLNISIENQRLPLSAREIKLKANETLSLPLGQVMIDLRKLHLNSRIEYIGHSHQEIRLDMSRIEQPPETEEELINEPAEGEPETPLIVEKPVDETNKMVETNSIDTNSSNDESITESITNWFKSIQKDLFD